MKVPLLDVCRQNLPLKAELTEAFERVLHSGQFINGREVEKFEAAAAAVAGTRYAIGMSSGTDAILVALMALGIGPGDEVICPSLTFFATAGCIVRVGARPVFAECCEECFNIDAAGIEALITPRTKAIIPVHLFGQPADMDPVLEVARRHGLAVIEDVAQAYGSEYRGRPAGSIGQFGTVSFFPSKNLGALGDAGLLVTNDPGLAETAVLLRNHGEHVKYHHRLVGGNFRLDALQAALLGVKLSRLPAYTSARQEHAFAYQAAFQGLKGLKTPVTHPDRIHIFNQYTIRTPRRDELKQFLQDQGIATAVYYPVPLHRQECFQHLGPFPELPKAEASANEVLSLPVFPELQREEQDAVVTAVREFFRRN